MTRRQRVLPLLGALLGFVGCAAIGYAIGRLIR